MLTISGKARTALDAICDTFVPGEDGLPSATELGVPEAILTAVGFVERNGEKLENLITQEFPLERAPEALRWAMDHPAEAMKVVIGDIN